jgi:hypothetical protein
MHRRQEVSYVITKEPATVRLSSYASWLYVSKNRTLNCNHYIEMYEVVNPEIPGLEPSNWRRDFGIEKKIRDPGIAIPLGVS